MIDPNFAKEIARHGRPDVLLCYQCKKCSNGCPVAFAMDIFPHQIMRAIQLGLRNEVLGSSTIWLCASCQTCSTRCPNDIDIAGVMDVLRQIALEYEITPKEPEVPIFHKTFLKSIKRHGKVFELGMMGFYKLRTRDLFSDMKLGAEMLKRGKFKLFPHRVQGTKEIKTIFKKVD